MTQAAYNEMMGLPAHTMNDLAYQATKGQRFDVAFEVLDADIEGVQLRFVSNSGYTCLHQACYSGNLEAVRRFVEMMMEQGCPENLVHRARRGSPEGSPLQVAKARKKTHCVEFLETHPVVTAMEQSWRDEADDEELARDARVEALVAHLNHTVYQAARAGRIDRLMVALLTDKPSLAYISPVSGYTCLHQVCYHGDTGNARFIVDHMKMSCPDLLQHVSHHGDPPGDTFLFVFF